MTKKILFQLLILLLLVNCAQAVNYYVSLGVDNVDNGVREWATGPGSGWNDTTTVLDSVEANVSGGDTVFFGAGTFIGQITPPGGGTVNARTCYADSGISLNPIKYTGLSHITGADVATDWTVYSGNVYKSYFAYTPIANYPAMYTASDNDSLLAYVSSIDAVDASGEYHHNPGTDSVYVYCYDGGNPNDHKILVANNYSTIDIPLNHSYITFIGLEVSYGNSVVMRLAGLNTDNPDYINVIHCVVHHVNNDGTSQNPSLISTRGTSGSLDTSTFSHGDTIRSCTLYAVRNGSSWTGHSKGICLYEANSCVVESCYVSGGGIGINIKGNYSSRTCPYNIVRFNTVENFASGIALTCWHVRDSIYGNVIKNGVSGAWGINVEGAGGDSTCRIFNNTIYNVDDPFVLAGMDGEGLDGTGDSRHFFKYNIVDFGGTGDAVIWGNIDITDTNNFYFDSNYYYQDGRSITIRRHGTFSAWQTAGFDVHSIVTNPGLNSFFEPTNISAWDNPITYGGRTWYGPGAVQTLWEPDPDCDLPGKVLNDGRSPADSATDVTQPITFTWQVVPTATEYQIQIDNDPDFNIPWVRNSTVTPITYITSGLAPGTTFYWQVRARNACGYGEWSDSWSFTTYCPPTPVPNNELPPDGADNQPQPITLDWSDISGADRYQVQVDNNPDFGSPESNQEPTSSNYIISGLEDGTAYFWHVRAHNACGWSDWSGASTFTTYSFASQTFDIYDLEVLNITDTSALVEWKTTEEATSRVAYGLTTAYGSLSDENANYQLIHSVLLTSLNHDTEYHFRVLCYNSENDLAISPDSTFHTKSTISGSGSTLTGSSNAEFGAIIPTLRVNNYDSNPSNEYFFEVAEDSSFAVQVASSPSLPQQSGLTTSWEIDEELNIGQTYYWRANLDNLVFTPVYFFVIRPKTYAMPNPFHPDSDPQATFANVPSGSNLVIMSISGNEVIRRWTNHNGGDIQWDGTNQAGNRVASQTYLWFVENTDISGKIIVIR